MVHCRECAALVADTMTLVQHRPSGAAIDIWQCNTCAATRSCRPRWRTRCPVCLDERTVFEDEEQSRLLDELKEEREFKQLVADILEIDLRQVTPQHMWTVLNGLFIGEREEEFMRPGWTVLATDVRGMPWFALDPSTSHGTWASHDVCGTVQNLTLARPECRVCPPEPGSRTHRAKADQPQMLYLIRWLDLLKFGHGDGNRMRSHRNAGCDVVQVLQGPHTDVVAAELRMKRHFRDQLIDPLEWEMPITFGTGSEVVPDDVPVRLADFLSGSNVKDVTHRWSR